jgi:cystathionine beta-synthase
LTKFVDDDWMAFNGFVDDATLEAQKERKQRFGGATIADLNLKPVVTVTAASKTGVAIDLLREKGFDQVPVANETGKLVGLVTLGNVLSAISRGRATVDTPVSEVMLDFRKLPEFEPNPAAAANIGTPAPKPKKRSFVDITVDTPLAALNRFFEHNSAAVVTERTTDGVKAVHVVTKVDLLTYLARNQSL